MVEELKYKVELRKEIYYYKDHSLKDLIKNQKQEFYEKGQIFMSGYDQEKKEMHFDDIEKKVIDKKNRYDEIPEELIEDYIELNWQKQWLDKIFEKKLEKLKEKYRQKNAIEVYAKHEGKIAESIQNIEELDSHDMKLKNYMKSEFDFMYQTSAGLGMATMMPLFIISRILESVDFASSQTALIASMVSMFAAFIPVTTITIADWIKLKKEYPKAVKILKKSGMYDLVLERLEIEKDIEYIEKTGEKRR